MTRSAWLGATAGAVVVLLVIGLSLDGSGPRRPLGVESTSPALDRAPSNALGDEAKLRSETESGNEAKPATVPPAVSSPPADFTVPAVGTSQVLSHHVSPSIPTLPAPLPPKIVGKLVGHVDVPPVFRTADRAALPRADRLLNRGYAVRASHADAEDGGRRILRDRPAADMAGLSATRARVQPAIARLSRQGTPQDMQQKAGPIRADLRRLEDAGQPVRDDIKALSSPASRFVPPVPARIPSIVPAAPAPATPVTPAPSAAVVAPEAPKPSDKSATKPKGPASSGQEFIMWGNK